MKVALYTLGVKNKEAMLLGIEQVKAFLKSINYPISVTVSETTAHFTGLPFTNDAVGNGVEVNPNDILTLSGDEDVTCLIYDKTLVTPNPTNPAHNPISKGNATPIQMSEQWYNDMPEVFAEFFLHELSHAIAYQLGVADDTHLKYDPKWNHRFNSLTNIDYYLFLIDGYNTKVNFLLDAIAKLKQMIINLLNKKTMDSILYTTAFNLLGKHLTMDDTVPAIVGCGEAVSYILNQVLPAGTIPEKGIAGTIGCEAFLADSPLFNEVDLSKAMPGDIIISVTDSGNGKVRGHVGVMGKFHVMSNNSLTGLWDTQWVMKDWLAHYQVVGGLRTRVFRMK